MILLNKTIYDFKMTAFYQGDFKEISLSQYANKWVVFLFYPADFTFVCPTELGDFADHYESFQAQGAEILSVSTDTHFTHLAWHESSPLVKKVTYPMVADPTGKLSRAFGVFNEETGLSYRGTFIIDPDRVLKIIEVNDNGIGRNAQETLRKLQAAQFVRDNGEVCPANWTPGERTLTPSVALVGKL